MSTPRTLITGASGFLGKHLVNHLSTQCDIGLLYSLGRGSLSLPGLEHRVCELGERDSVDKAIQEIRPDRVYHLAGISRVSSEISLPDYFAGNALTTLLLAESLSKLQKPVKIFLGSSVHVYGNQAGVVAEADDLHPQSPYAFTKFLSEQTLKHYTEKCPQMRAVVGRLYSCFGPGQQPGFVTSDLCRKIKALPGDGTGTLKVGSLTAYRRFLDARDAVKLFPLLLDHPKNSPFEVFNLASPHELPIQDVLDMLLEVSGRKAKIESTDSGTNPFTGLKVSTEKLTGNFPETQFRPVKETLTDMWREVSTTLN